MHPIEPCTPLVSTYGRTYGSTYAVAYLPLHTPASLYGMNDCVQRLTAADWSASFDNS